MKNFKNLLFVLLLTGCTKELPIIPNEEELITTVRLTCLPENGGDSVIFEYKDVDGEGGTAPEIKNGILSANTTYQMTVELLNESVSPVENITEEVKEEGIDHQIFYIIENPNLTISYTDQDENGLPIGLENTLKTSENANGNLTVTLKHKPMKSASGVSNGNISNAGGETDVEVTFYVQIQ